MKPLMLAAALAISGSAYAQTAPAAQDTPAQGNNGAEVLGGYAPAAPLFSSPPQPGDKVIFVPSTQTPDQAFPAPAPQASYPICKRGQYDNCMQRGG